MSTEPAAPVLSPATLAAIAGVPVLPYKHIMEAKIFMDDRGVQVEHRTVVAGEAPEGFCAWRVIMPLYDNQNRFAGKDYVDLPQEADARAKREKPRLLTPGQNPFQHRR